MADATNDTEASLTNPSKEANQALRLEQRANAARKVLNVRAEEADSQAFSLLSRDPTPASRQANNRYERAEAIAGGKEPPAVLSHEDAMRRSEEVTQNRIKRIEQRGRAANAQVKNRLDAALEAGPGDSRASQRFARANAIAQGEIPEVADSHKAAVKSSKEYLDTLYEEKRWAEHREHRLAQREQAAANNLQSRQQQAEAEFVKRGRHGEQTAASHLADNRAERASALSAGENAPAVLQAHDAASFAKADADYNKASNRVHRHEQLQRAAENNYPARSNKAWGGSYVRGPQGETLPETRIDYNRASRANAIKLGWQAGPKLGRDEAISQTEAQIEQLKLERQQRVERIGELRKLAKDGRKDLIAQDVLARRESLRDLSLTSHSEPEPHRLESRVARAQALAQGQADPGIMKASEIQRRANVAAIGEGKIDSSIPAYRVLQAREAKAAELAEKFGADHPLAEAAKHRAEHAADVSAGRTPKAAYRPPALPDIANESEVAPKAKPRPDPRIAPPGKPAYPGGGSSKPEHVIPRINKPTQPLRAAANGPQIASPAGGGRPLIDSKGGGVKELGKGLKKAGGALKDAFTEGGIVHSAAGKTKILGRNALVGAAALGALAYLASGTRNARKGNDYVPDSLDTNELPAVKTADDFGPPPTALPPTLDGVPLVKNGPKAQQVLARRGNQNGIDTTSPNIEAADGASIIDGKRIQDLGAAGPAMG